MITINLLPEEYRKKNRTPVKLMLTLVAAVAINASLVAWWAWLAFGVNAEVTSEETVLATEKEGLDPQVAYHRALEVEQNRFAARELALGKITKNRISWTKKVDQLIDVVHRGGEGDRHYVWLDDLTIDQNANPRTGSFGSVRANGHSGSDNFAQVANFLEDLETSVFIEDFAPPAPPEGTQTIKDEELIPSEVWAFPLVLSLKNPEERQ